MQNSLRRSIGSRLEEWRKRNNLTQFDLAQLVGKTFQHISHVECGRRGLNFYALAELGLNTQKQLKEPLDLNWLLTGKSIQNDVM